MNRELIRRQEGLFESLALYRENDCLILKPFEEYTYSEIYINDPLQDQTSLTMTSLAAVTKPHKVLILGAGLFENAIQLIRINADMDITAVDIEPVMYQWVNELCGSLIHENVHFIQEDARQFIRCNTDQYDYIIVDLFHGKDMPCHCATQEFFALLSDCLQETGAMLLNSTIPATYRYFNYCSQEHPLHKFESTVFHSRFTSVFINDVTNAGVLIAFKQKMDNKTLQKQIRAVYVDPDTNEHIRASLGAMTIGLFQALEQSKEIKYFQDADGKFNIKQMYIEYLRRAFKSYLKGIDPVQKSFVAVCNDYFYHSFDSKEPYTRHADTVLFLKRLYFFMPKAPIREMLSSIYIEDFADDIGLKGEAQNICNVFYQMVLCIRNNQSAEAVSLLQKCGVLLSQAEDAYDAGR